MAKIDTTKIEGYEDMSAEDKLKALTEYEFEVPKQDTTESDRLKAALSKANSEAAEWKRQAREKQTEQERAEADRAEAEQKLRDELESYRVKERVSNYKARLMEAGFDAETASVMAGQLPDGVTDDYFAATKTFIESQKQALLSEALNKQPKLSAGMPPSGQSAEETEMAKLRKYIGL